MVDELRLYPHARHACFRAGACHLTAGSIADLHDFATRIGLRRAWFQDHPIAPHYDLTPGKRELALRSGAVFVPARDQALRRRGMGGIAAGKDARNPLATDYDPSTWAADDTPPGAIVGRQGGARKIGKDARAGQEALAQLLERTRLTSEALADACGVPLHVIEHVIAAEWSPSPMIKLRICALLSKADLRHLINAIEHWK